MRLAPGVELLRAGPGRTLNAYLVGSTLVDSGIWLSAGRLRRQLQGRSVTQHALTHAHADHAGSSARLCTGLGLSLAVGTGDVDAVRSGQVATHGGRLPRLLMGLLPVAGHPVDRVLREGDELDAGFTVLEVPGHSPGSIALWRERDRVLLTGDVLLNLPPRRGGGPRLRHVPAVLHADARANTAALRRLVALRPRLAGFGHGPPVTDPGRLADGLARLSP